MSSKEHSILIQDKLENEQLNADKYFQILKSNRHFMTGSRLEEIYDKSLILFSKFKKTGQIKSMKKLIFIVDTLAKEQTLINHGINTYVLKDDIEYYISKLAENDVSFVELERYERAIPDNVIDKIEELKVIVPSFYILFTDYTHQTQKGLKREAEVHKDPILFGVFEDDLNISDRFYFIADWVDEYCDLTFDKFVSAFNPDKNVAKSAISAKEISDLHEFLDNYEYKDGTYQKKQEDLSFIERMLAKVSYFFGGKDL